MEGFEIAKLPKGVEGYISEFEVATPTKYNPEIKELEVDQSKLENYAAHFDLFVSSIRTIYSFSDTVIKGTPKFCLALRTLFYNSAYVSKKNAAFYCNNKFKYSLSVLDFEEIVQNLGISTSAAYRYKDLAIFVDPDTCEYYDEFKGYSISLLSEILVFCNKIHVYGLAEIKKLVKLIPYDTTVDKMREYSRAYMELSAGKSVYSDIDNKERNKLFDLTVGAFLDDYHKRVEKYEAERLEGTLKAVNSVPKEDKSKKVLPSSDEMIVKKSEWVSIKELARRSEDIGKCTGCKFSGVNLNKCRCCRRYKDLKDLYEKG